MHNPVLLCYRSLIGGGRREDLDGNITIIRHYGSSLVLKRIVRMRHASLSIHYAASSFLAAPNEGGIKENTAISMLSALLLRSNFSLFYFVF